MAVKKSKTKFRKIQFSTVVKSVEPNPPKEPAYIFSNGIRKYRKGRLT